MTNNKIPIGKATVAGTDYYHVKLRFRKGIIVKPGDIITLDMIEPYYESEAVRKVAEYLHGLDNLSDKKSIKHYEDRAKSIIDLVHEAEDSDE